ncbi:tetratricopeptide repeat protein 39B-like isoform X2 [Brevipalpus obovatus]|uniref:tetratricopeptide repeat protein 39B-like isoform X2 n=1 Tax=Brevipalpus obovatus TaxID=246614 RepID=UPI003D9E5273
MIFEDAVEETPPSIERVPTLEEDMNEVNTILEMALNNQFEEALKIANKWAETSLYHALGRATLCFFKGILTLEDEQIKTTMDALKHVSNLYQLKRRQMNSVSRVVWRPNYNQYTESEVHAELVYAESQLMHALMTFLLDQNLVSLVKGALKIRSCYQSYKECKSIMNQRVNWASERSKIHFESGVRMGIGTFNLMISHMPNKVLRLLEFVGFSGNRNIGFQELEKSKNMNEGLRSPLSKLILLGYYCYIEHLFGLGDEDLTSAKEINSNCLKRFPNSAFFILFAGRINQLEGEIREAIQNFQKCIAIQNQWKQLHNICYWELLWCYTIKCDWKQAGKMAEILRAGCAWSPATYAYQSAVLRFMSLEDNPTKEQRAEIMELLKKVPSLRIRYAGKTIPAEKFAITTSERYVSGVKELVAPGLEFMYIWNIWAILEKDKKLVDPILDLIESKLSKLKHVLESKDSPMDDYLDLVLLRGLCLRALGYHFQAEECFLLIINNEKRIVRDTYLPPHAAMELGLTFVRLGQFRTAHEWLEKSRKNYTGYLLETMVHFRVHCALRNIKIMEQERGSSEDLEKVSQESRELSPDSDESLSSNGDCLDSELKKPSDLIEKGDKIHILSETARSLIPLHGSYEECVVKL